MNWIQWAIAGYLAIGLGCARWTANLARVQPWRGRMNTLRNGFAEAGLPPGLIIGAMYVFIGATWPVSWPSGWWSARHDDGAPLDPDGDPD